MVRILLDTTIIVAIVTALGMLLTEIVRHYLQARAEQRRKGGEG
jgi:formate hydrogenlyase subunit 4